MKSIEDIIQNLRGQFENIIPNILVFLVVIGLGYVVARFIKYLITLLFKYLGKLAKQKSNHLNFKQAGFFIGSVFFWLIMFFSVLLVTDILRLMVLRTWFLSIVQYIPNIFAAILIVFSAIVLGNLSSHLLLSSGKRTGIKYSTALVRLIRFVLLIVAVIIALDQIGIEISLLIDIIDIVLAAILFGASLAFGLGARTSISNILACYYVRKRYKEGDEIQIGKTKGIIIRIEASNVVLENKIGQVTIPGKIFNETKSYLITRS